MTRIKPFAATHAAIAQDTASTHGAFLHHNSIELPYLIWKESPPHFLFDSQASCKPKRSLYSHPHAIRGVLLTEKTINPLPKNPILKKYARQMRMESTITQIMFWVQVEQGHFHHIEFQRHRIISDFIVDFYIPKLQLVIEIDGDRHKGKQEYDALREAALKALGLTVYRIDAADVKYGIKTTMVKLEQFILETYSVRQAVPTCEVEIEH